MKPRGPLMIEHRLIEKVFRIVDREIVVIRETETVDPIFIDTIVDFIRMYADRTHHGKEEDILFRELENKNLNEKERAMMKELVDEHIFARGVVKELVDARNEYVNGDDLSLLTVAEKLETLVNFYPEHIRKEDEDFFPATEAYFSEDELATMLKEFYDFDSRMIHEKYSKLYEDMEKEYPI